MSTFDDTSTLMPLQQRMVLRAEKLQELRLFFGVTQHELARAIDVTGATISNWENARTEVPLVVIKYLELLREKTVNAAKLQQEIMAIREEAGMDISQRQGAVTTHNPWEQLDFLNDLKELEGGN